MSPISSWLRSNQRPRDDRTRDLLDAMLWQAAEQQVVIAERGFDELAAVRVTQSERRWIVARARVRDLDARAVVELREAANRGDVVGECEVRAFFDPAVRVVTEHELELGIAHERRAIAA